MKYLKKYENCIDENYISDIFYSLQPYNISYYWQRPCTYSSIGPLIESHWIKGYAVILLCKRMKINDHMINELKESIQHFENYIGNIKFDYLDIRSDIHVMFNLYQYEDIRLLNKRPEREFIHLLNTEDVQMRLYFKKIYNL
jgi:hypothetical protein